MVKRPCWVGWWVRYRGALLCLRLPPSFDCRVVGYSERGVCYQTYANEREGKWAEQDSVDEMARDAHDAEANDGLEPPDYGYPRRSNKDLSSSGNTKAGDIVVWWGLVTLELLIDRRVLSDCWLLHLDSECLGGRGVF